MEMTPEGCGAFVVAKKLAGLSERLRRWAKVCFGSIKLKKLNLLHEVEKLDVLKEARNLSLGELAQELHLLNSLEDIRKQEEINWRQRSRLQWLQEGDENTKFFHSMANGRKCRNLIPGFFHESRLISNPKAVGRMFVNRFQQQFGSKRTWRLKVDLSKLLAHKRHVDLTGLDRPFTMIEVKDAVFSLGGIKPLDRMDSRSTSSTNSGRQSRTTFSSSVRISILEELI
ncbi:uncharacterized protein LOC120253385 [Dioscorea cayenensis subsp. rotundata]|uniref:Uncharacterized protein LOC120253385 n=1 Tax=Dioscorea cayennensis subsp. rotundata TaxID=55577 RepID=A0AB40AS07_DIOCR|nr:uncharacterized protein LOC120253385 [Dioscorea cayenensis subsp. rotundata]